MTAKRTWFLIGLSLLVILCYRGVTYHDFVYLDDGPYLFSNPWTMQGLTLETVWHFLTNTNGGQYIPVTMISYLPGVSLFGMTAPVQIWINVLFHIANCLLVVWVFQKYTGTFWRPAIIATLLAIHPIHVESVAWATERKDVLFMFFGLLCLGFYHDYAKRPTPLLYAIVLGCYILSMLSKMMLVTMPALLLLLDVWPLRRIRHPWLATTGISAAGTDVQPLTANQIPTWKLLAEKAPFLAVGIILTLVTVLSTPVVDTEFIGLDIRLGIAVIGYADYLGMFFWPVDLCGFYPLPNLLDKSAVIIRLGILIAITAICAWQWKKRPYLLFGWLWYGITLLPVSGVLQAGEQARADRFVYWPALGIYMSLVFLAWETLLRLTQARSAKAPTSTTAAPDNQPTTTPMSAQAAPPLARKLAVACVAGLLVLLAPLSYYQVGTWKNSEIFFSRIIRLTEGSTKPHSGLVVYYIDNKRYDDAVAVLLKALEIDSTPTASLAEVAMLQGNYTLALTLADKALALSTKPGESASNAALILLNLGQPARALEAVNRCLANQPDNHTVLTNAGVIYVANGHTAQGIDMLLKALKISPKNPDILVNLGSAYGNTRQFDKAQDAFQQALAIHPAHIPAHQKLGLLYLITGKPKLAEQTFKNGLAHAPDDPQLSEGLNRAIQAQQKTQP